ncbi:MAG: hypothetical protein WC140_05060 [Bacteroidales bacterium]
MKNFKSILIISLLLLSTILFSSCSEKKVTNFYSISRSNINTSVTTDPTVVSDYMTSIGITIMEISIEGDSESDNNAEAVASWNAKIKTFNKTELLSKLSDKNTSFTYVMNTTESGTQIAKFSYNE